VPLPPLHLELSALADRDRLRTLRLLDGPSRSRGISAGSPVLTFSSNDYLGLADHPSLTAAAATAAARHGFGAGASRLLSGHLPPHDDLEQALADLVRLPAALLYSTGYHANLGAVTSLAGPDDLIASDEANHASLIDGCRLSRAKIAVYRHADSASARDALQTPGTYRRRLLITESLFSMDGDAAPLTELSVLAQAFEATFIVDEAHALGVLGPNGRGLCQEARITPDVLIGTLGKAFGSFGGFVAGSAILRTYLLNRSRSFIFTTAPPPPVAAASLAAVRISLSDEGERRRAQLFRSIAALTTAIRHLSPIQPPRFASPILPLILGSDITALAASAHLASLGIFVPAIRPPTVREGTSRLRITLSAAHNNDDIARLASALSSASP
jgi:8-amino-7-oxononanoate synthase